MNRMFKSFLIVIAFVGFFTSAFDGYSMDAQQRLAIIKGLKLNGLVGENNQGYLEFRTSDTSASAVVNEENNERKKAYTDIANKTGVSATTVGAQRAAQIASSASKGDWIQKADGSWHKKQ